jgi:hypothetical protein
MYYFTVILSIGTNSSSRKILKPDNNLQKSQGLVVNISSKINRIFLFVLLVISISKISPISRFNGRGNISNEVPLNINDLYKMKTDAYRWGLSRICTPLLLKSDSKQSICDLQDKFVLSEFSKSAKTLKKIFSCSDSSKSIITLLAFELDVIEKTIDLEFRKDTLIFAIDSFKDRLYGIENELKDKAISLDDVDDLTEALKSELEDSKFATRGIGRGKMTSTFGEYLKTAKELIKPICLREKIILSAGGVTGIYCWWRIRSLKKQIR